MSFFKVLGAEVMKLRRSAMIWASLLFYVFFGLMAWFVMWMVKNPEAARSLGLLGQKASFAANGMGPDWASLLVFIAEMSAVGGMVILSIIVAYLFGREYVEGTAKNMLALPVRRGYFLAAKLCIAALWFALLTALIIGEGAIVGVVLRLGPFPLASFLRSSGDIMVASALVFCLQPIVAWITIASGGYIAPFGYTIATILIGNLMVRTDWARWCPYSIVALLGGLTGPRQPGILLGSGLVLAATLALGIVGALLHQSKADNCQ